MSIIEAVILAIVEGLTEFLPVSSTGHMVLTSSIMGIAEEPFTKLFTVVIQLGAILSVVVLYFKRFFQTINFYFKLFVTATDLHKIFTIHLSGTPTFEELVIADSIKGPNGITYSKKDDRLYVCGFGENFMPVGEIGYIDLGKPIKHFTKLTSRQGYYDGIGILDDHTIVVSDWVAFEKKGVIFMVNIHTGEINNINKELIAGPADFMVNDKREIISPEMMQSRIIKFEVK